MAVVINAETFGRRIKQLYEAWRDNRASVWNGATALGISVGAASEDLRYHKSISLQMWLFGYELPDTIMLMTDKELHVLSSAKKTALLEPLRAALKEAAGADLVLHPRAKGDDGAALIDALLSAARASSSSSSSSAPVLGATLKDAHEGALSALWQAKLQEATAAPAADGTEDANNKTMALVSAADGIASLLALKDGAEAVSVRKAGLLAARVLQEYLLPKVEKSIDEEKRVRHSKLSELADSAISDPSKAGARLKPENVDIAYPSMIQSGGNYDLRLGAPAPDGGEGTLAHSGAVVCSVGARYSSYCASVSRTYLFDPTPEMEREYAALLSAHRAAVAALVEGAAMSAAHSAAVAALEGAGEAGARLLTAGGPGKSVGHGIGLELKETGSNLSAKNTAGIVKAGMCFNVSVGVAGLERPDENDGAVKKEEGGEDGAGGSGGNNNKTSSSLPKTYALQVADTVVVQPGGAPPEVATSHAIKEADRVTYMIQQDKQDKAAAAAAALAKKENGGDDDDTKGGRRADSNSGGPGGADGDDELRRKQLRSDAPEFKAEHAERKARQDELLDRKNAETLARLTAQRDGNGGAGGSGAGGAGGAGGARLASQVVAYRSAADLPVPPGAGLQVAVDPRAEAVLLPIYGVLVPFHVATVRGVAHVADGASHATIRVSFNVGAAGAVGGGASGGGYEPARRFPGAALVKELSFRTSDVRHAAKVVQELKTLRSAVLARDKERAERATLVAQEKLVRGKQVFRLADLWVRPSLGGKGRKVPGTLEAHQNGFRYFTPKGETVDVMYRNIRHAFHQPADKEMVAILHFHLLHPIMLGNKKCRDVQFYTEVGDVVQTLDGGRRSMYDPDEIEEEQRERERRNRVNADFAKFARRVQEGCWEPQGMDLEFDIPFRELAFEGVPFRSTVNVLPTVNCLVELTEMPFLVCPLEEIEIVNLERVGLNLKNFDMAIVFKDFTKEVLRIDAIPSRRLDTVKDWLTSVSIKFYESRLNLAWKPILRSIQENPEEFVENGGWKFLDLEGSDSEAEDEDESEGFRPSSGEEGSSSDDDDSDDDDEDGTSLEAEESSDEDASEELDTDESEGKTWSDLEDEARKSDKKRAERGDSEEEEKPKKKSKGGGGGGGKKR